MLKEAPLAIVVCGDTSNLKYDGGFWIQDISACIQNILIEGQHLGLELVGVGFILGRNLLKGLQIY